MRDVNLKVKLLGAGLAALVLGGLAPVALAGTSGAGGEGVVACPSGSPDYLPPPLKGTIVLESGTDSSGQPVFKVSTDGDVAQLGNGDCSVNIASANALLVPAGVDTLETVKGADVQGLCFSITSACTAGGAVLEVLGAGNRKTVGSTVTFDVILMKRLQ